MTDDLDLMAQAVQRDGGYCVVCGCPCGPQDARRRIDPGPAGDGPMNFVAMCGGCRGFLGGKLPPPARYIAHIYDAGRFRRSLRKFASLALAALFLGAYFVLCGIVGYLLRLGVSSPLQALASAVLILFLFAISFRIYHGIWGETEEPPVQRVHHTFDPQRVITD